MVFLDNNLLAKIQEVEGSSYKEIDWVQGIIYGSGGVNRYYINTMDEFGELKFETFEQNEVLFSLFHGYTKDFPKVEKAGFRLFD